MRIGPGGTVAVVRRVTCGPKSS